MEMDGKTMSPHAPELTAATNDAQFLENYRSNGCPLTSHVHCSSRSAHVKSRFIHKRRGQRSHEWRSRHKWTPHPIPPPRFPVAVPEAKYAMNRAGLGPVAIEEL
jgi:hypothetical protein